MMARIIPLHGSRHDDAQRLLPWYVSGELDATDFAVVDGHLAECAECRADLQWEQSLMAEVEALPQPAADDWAALPVRPPVTALSPHRPIWASLADLWHAATRPVSLGWALAGQAAIVAAAFAVVPFLSRPAMYQALSAPQPVAVGNVIVIFRPDAREQDLRRILTATGARMVDGPTPADAYVLQVAPGRRAAVLTRLRAQREIVVAQPIDPAPPS
jgi:anti-sigma factor RsiW